MVTFKEWGIRRPARDWLWQRLTAAGILVYAIVFFVWAIETPALSFSVWHDLFAQTWLKIAALPFFIFVAYHAWIGMYNIFVDYVHHAGLRRALLQATALSLAAQVVWLVAILWNVK